MNFKKSYEKVKWIVWKCEKEFYIHLWDHADWEQEGRLVLYELQISNPEVEENEEILLTYFKTKFRNHIKDKVRKQESDKRKLNKVPYTEIGEISHRLRSKELFLDELVLLRGALKEFRENLTDQEKEEYDKLLEEAKHALNKNLSQNEVDQLVVDVYNIYIDEMKKYPNTRYGRGPIGGIRYAGTSSISANVGQGYGTMATPDGRKAHTPLAEGCSPAHAMDKKGPTAVFKSVSKLPTHEITGGVLLNQKVTPQLLSKEENKEKIEMLIKTFFNRLKGYHVQYNVVSKETLLDAQAHPEKHKDLIVRVAGYSAFFNVLSKATQDDIIGRTEQTL